MEPLIESNIDLEIAYLGARLSENGNVPFCYSCYRVAPSGICTFCGSDDLMRLSYDGCDYEVNQIRPKRIRSDILPIDVSRAFEEFIKTCYPQEFRIGWMTIETVECMKTMDPFSWTVEMDQWIAQNIEEGVFITFDRGKTYYYQSDFESADQLIYKEKVSISQESNKQPIVVGAGAETFQEASDSCNFS